ncbi:MAG: LLM class F420-dependent oxidoreductase [Actinobacteria bacterium]|nr:LLM class F420-dependent oxidoreductase [Actinomycetota bacterium]
MRLALNLGYWGSGPADFIPIVQEAENLGYESVWTAEAYGSDAVVPLAWVAASTSRINVGSAILQMPARTPANTAMTAATLDMLSGGRFKLGLGLSGPQVVEGWHGVPYGRPLAKTREYISIVREILKREKPLEHHGEHYDIPYSGPGATGLGKALKLITHPLRADIPIYLAAIGPKNVGLAAEIADGWLPIFFSPYRFTEVFGPVLDEGFARATQSAEDGSGGAAKSLDTFDVAATVPVILGDDVQACMGFVKPMLALYIGGMGARGKNFYFDLACRYGFEGAAHEIQDLYLDGKKPEATAAVPDDLVDEIALVGPAERITERVQPWLECGIGTMILGAGQPEALRLMAELVL